MKKYCYNCGEEKEHRNWRYKSIEDEHGVVKDVYICGDHFKPTKAEFLPERVREDRRVYAKDLIQPFRDNTLSKEYVDTYGTSNLDVTDKEVRNAKNVWK